MATYIALVNFTDQGIRDIKASPGRVEAAKKLLNDLGGEMGQIFLTMGSHDAVFLMDLPDDAAAARFALTLGSFGNVRTNTLKAIPEDEYVEIIASLP